EETSTVAKMKKPGDKSPKRRKKPAPLSGDILPLPPREMMEAMFRHMLGGGPPGAGETSLERAQDLIYEARTQEDPERAGALAREALELSADCADAYVLLAELAPTRKESLELY